MEIYFNLLSRHPLEEQTQGREILEALCRIAPTLTPSVFGNHEPLKKKFSLDNLDDVLESWRPPLFFWKRSRPSSDGCAFIPPRRTQHSAIVVSAEAEAVDSLTSINLFCELTRIMSPDFGCIQLLSSLEIERGLADDTVNYLDTAHRRSTFMITGHLLRKYLPDMYWATVFGPAYVQQFGRKRLLSIPAPIVREVGDSVYIQLSEEILDVQRNPTVIDSIRIAIKEHLGVDSFFSPLRGTQATYRVPNFDAIH